MANALPIPRRDTGAQTGSIILTSNGELRIHAAEQAGEAVAVTGGLPLAGAAACSPDGARVVTAKLRQG